jgi:hypothetical protein
LKVNIGPFLRTGTERTATQAYSDLEEVKAEMADEEEQGGTDDSSTVDDNTPTEEGVEPIETQPIWGGDETGNDAKLELDTDFHFRGRSKVEKKIERDS